MMMDNATLEVALRTFGLIVIAELGDKSFFVAMVLSMRRGASKPLIFLGCMVALALNTALAALVGRGLAALLDTHETLVHYLAALVFMAFSFKMAFDFKDASADSCGALQEAEDELGAKLHTTALQTFAAAFIANFVGELGDKTQVAVVVQASQTPNVFGVIAGSAAGFAVVTSLAIALGSALSYLRAVACRCGRAAAAERVLSHLLTERRVLGAGAILFFGFSLLALAETVGA